MDDYGAGLGEIFSGYEPNAEEEGPNTAFLDFAPARRMTAEAVEEDEIVENGAAAGEAAGTEAATDAAEDVDLTGTIPLRDLAKLLKLLEISGQITRRPVPLCVGTPPIGRYIC